MVNAPGVGAAGERAGVRGADGIRLLPFGDRGVLAQLPSLDDVLALHARLEAARPAGVVDLVPAACTVLVVVDPAVLTVAAARSWITAAASVDAVAATRSARQVEVPIVYDGDDLDDVAALLDVTTEELVARHAAAAWTVAFTGFAPGFGYLVSADWPFEIARRDRPRPRVPAGAVGVAGRFSGAYPRATPGGWQLIGTTSAPLFDPDAATPALLQPGDRVRFVPAARPRPRAETRLSAPEPGGPELSRGAAAPQAVRGGIRVIEPGLRATVQDQGRPGWLATGVASSGAADRAALRTANRLVGNPEDAAGVEITMGGFRAVHDAAASDAAEPEVWFAITGAWGAIRLDGARVDPYAAHRWPVGAQLHVDWFERGARGYLAVRGGIDAPALLGSRATDTLAGLGPAPLAAGSTLAVGEAAAGPIPPDDLRPWTAVGDELEIALAPGPRADRFRTLAPLFEGLWTVSEQADRVGIRLDGPGLDRIDITELESEGMLPGAIQVPPDARPVILGPDGPVTGGYPVVAVVVDAARDALGQATPGTRIRFRHARGGV